MLVDGRWPTGGMLIRHGPPSDFGPYHTIAFVWERGKGTTTLCTDDARNRLPSPPVGQAEVAWVSGLIQYCVKMHNSWVLKDVLLRSSGFRRQLLHVYYSWH